jgi:hypothetical protein
VRPLGLEPMTSGLWHTKTYHCATQVNSFARHLVFYLLLSSLIARFYLNQSAAPLRFPRSIRRARSNLARSATPPTRRSHHHTPNPPLPPSMGSPEDSRKRSEHARRQKCDAYGRFSSAAEPVQEAGARREKKKRSIAVRAPEASARQEKRSTAVRAPEASARQEKRSAAVRAPVLSTAGRRSSAPALAPSPASWPRRRRPSI